VSADRSRRNTIGIDADSNQSCRSGFRRDRSVDGSIVAAEAAPTDICTGTARGCYYELEALPFTDREGLFSCLKVGVEPRVQVREHDGPVHRELVVDLMLEALVELEGLVLGADLLIELLLA